MAPGYQAPQTWRPYSQLNSQSIGEVCDRNSATAAEGALVKVRISNVEIWFFSDKEQRQQELETGNDI